MMDVVKRMDELIKAIDGAFTGREISENDLYGILQVVTERRDAEIARQSMTDALAQRAWHWLNNLKMCAAEAHHRGVPIYIDQGDLPDTVDNCRIILKNLQEYQPKKMRRLDGLTIEQIMDLDPTWGEVMDWIENSDSEELRVLRAEIRLRFSPLLREVKRPEDSNGK